LAWIRERKKAASCLAPGAWCRLGLPRSTALGGRARLAQRLAQRIDWVLSCCGVLCRWTAGYSSSLVGSVTPTGSSTGGWARRPQRAGTHARWRTSCAATNTSVTRTWERNSTSVCTGVQSEGSRASVRPWCGWFDCFAATDRSALLQLGGCSGSICMLELFEWGGQPLTSQ
jgi:hypothetical protein